MERQPSPSRMWSSSWGCVSTGYSLTKEFEFHRSQSSKLYIYREIFVEDTANS
ncbi:hypothetical protein LINPERHAP1_LOCUS30658 [Linum perenne]